MKRAVMSKTSKIAYRIGAVSTAAVLGATLLSGCMDAADRGLGPACESELMAAEADLKRAEANSIGKAVNWSRAGALIAAGRTQQQFSEYQNCVLKAQSARRILSRIE